jgi:hypothetical protein
MKKRKLFRTIYLYFKRLKYHYETLKAGPAVFQVDLGKRR